MDFNQPLPGFIVVPKRAGSQPVAALLGFFLPQGVLPLPFPDRPEVRGVVDIVQGSPSGIHLPDVPGGIGHEDTGHHLPIPVDVQVPPAPASARGDTPVAHRTAVPKIRQHDLPLPDDLPGPPPHSKPLLWGNHEFRIVAPADGHILENPPENGLLLIKKKVEEIVRENLPGIPTGGGQGNSERNPGPPKKRHAS